MTPVVGLLLLGLFAHPQIEVQHVHVKAWTVAVAHDRFTGQVRCSASAPGLRLVDGELIVRLHSPLDLENAVYRLDGGEARRVANLSSDARDRDTRNAAMDGETIIVFKVGDVAAVRRIDARSDPKSQVTSFDVSSVPAVLSVEVAHGCAPPASIASN